MANPPIVCAFMSSVLPDDTFLVIKVAGVEELARTFRFELQLVSRNAGIDLKRVMGSQIRLAFNRTIGLSGNRTANTTYEYHGILDQITLVGRAGEGRYRYTAVFVPHTKALERTRRSRIYTDKSIPEVLTAVLDGAGIVHRLKLADRKSYPIHPYIVQYEETDLDFITRWMEQEGLTSYYQTIDDHGCLVITDGVQGWIPIDPLEERVPYNEDGAGAWNAVATASVTSFEVHHRRVPKSLQLKEYNYEAPADEMLYKTEVDPDGDGTWYEYNANFRNEAEARFLLRVRRDQWLGLRQRMFGQADHRSFQPGRTFRLVNHFSPAIDQERFVLVKVEHRVEQEVSGGSFAIIGSEYRCSFEAMPADLPHRPERITDWPSIHGVVHARIAGGALSYAELDEMGRYKVDVDYDVNDQTIARVRMAQPSVGEDAGMHFPLRKHTEVLLGHIDGDPDKPVILGAVHCGEKINLLDRAKDPLGTNNKLKSQSGNVLHMNDGGNQPHMEIANGSFSMYQRFGNPNYHGESPQAEPAAQFAGGRPKRLRPGAKELPQSADRTAGTSAQFSSSSGGGSSGGSSGGGNNSDNGEPQNDDQAEGKNAGDTPMLAFWNKVNGERWSINGVKNSDAPVTNWQTQSVEDFTAMYRAFAVQPTTHYHSPDDNSAPTSFPSMSGSGSLNTITAQGMPAKGTADPDALFANYEACVGGKQEFIIGDAMEVAHGNKWEYRKGNAHEFKDGNKFEFDLSGYTVGYSWNKLEISYGKGTSKEVSYLEGKKEFCYISGSSSTYERFGGDKTEESSVNSSYVTETVRDLARETSHIARKEEYSAVGGSVALAVGGPSFEMSVNLKVEIEAAAKLEIYLGALCEITLALKCEINPFSVHKIGLEETEAKAMDLRLAAMEQATAAVDTKVDGLNILTAAAIKDSVAAAMKDVGVEMEKSGATLSTVGAHLKTGFTMVL